MKISIELNEIELNLLSEVVNQVNAPEQTFEILMANTKFLRWAVIQQLQERANKRLIRMEPGRHKFYLSELIVLHDFLLMMSMEDDLKTTFRNLLLAKLNKAIYGENVLSQ